MFLLFLFWFSLLALGFTYAGYPLLLWLLAPTRPKPVVHPGPEWQPMVTVIVPARNEARNIEAKLRNLAEMEYPEDRREILVVDDCSEDDTAILAAGVQLAGLRVLALRERHGKSGALNRAVEEARGEILIFTDADSLIAPDGIRWLVRPFVNPIVGCVAGEYHAGGVKGQNACGVGFYWRYENFLRRKESDVGGLLGASGSLYALRRELFEPLREGLINDDFVVPMVAASKGYRTLYEPRAWAVEDERRNEQLEFGRRVRIMAGNCQHLWMFRHLLIRAPFSRMGFQLFCHKLLRVSSPLFLAAALLSSLALSGSWFYYGLFSFQAGLYIAALVAQIFKPRGRFSSVVNLPRYFLLINLSALLGIYYYLLSGSAVPWNLGVEQDVMAKSRASVGAHSNV